jgi:hypothetical protein
MIISLNNGIIVIKTYIRTQIKFLTLNFIIGRFTLIIANEAKQYELLSVDLLCYAFV